LEEDTPKEVTHWWNILRRMVFAMASKRRPRRTSTKKANVEVIVATSLPPTSQLALLLAETMRVSGFGNVAALAPGFGAPDIIRGIHKNHRPHVYATTTDGRPVYVDVYNANLSLVETASRWTLFYSSANSARGQFHVVTTTAVGRAPILERARTIGVSVTKIWEV